MDAMTEKATHTPGPWEVARAHSYANGVIIATELFVRCPEDDIAIASDIANPGSGAVDEVAEGNARLIAAAPDLYDALHALVDFRTSEEGLSHLQYRVRCEELERQARAALAKATGKALTASELAAA